MTENKLVFDTKEEMEEFIKNPPRVITEKEKKLMWSKGKPLIEKRIENCICGNGNAHSRECKTHRERLSFLERQKKIRKEKRANHICTYGGCKEKIKPIPYYFQFCNKHKPKPKIKEK